MSTDTDASEAEPVWTRALPLNDLKKRGKAVKKLAGKQILLLSSGGRIYAFNNRCPHEGFPSPKAPSAMIAS